MYSTRRGLGVIQSDPNQLAQCNAYTPQFTNGWDGTPTQAWYFGGELVSGPLIAPVGPLPTGPDGSAQPGGTVYPAYVAPGSCTVQFDRSSPQPNPFNMQAAGQFQAAAAQAVSQQAQQAIAAASPASPANPAPSSSPSSSLPTTTPGGQTIINSSGAGQEVVSTGTSSGDWFAGIPNWVLIAAAGGGLLLLMMGGGSGK